MKPVTDAHGLEAIVTPSLPGNPLAEWVLQGNGKRAEEAVLTPCLPNYFVAEVPREKAEALAGDCEKACRSAWKEIATQVREALDQPARSLNGGWADLWDKQIDSFFEIRTAVLPWDECAEATLRQLEGQGADPNADLWSRRMHVTGALMPIVRSVRHVPDYRLGDVPVPPKCSLLGTYEQMGPAGLEASRGFWKAFARDGLRGTRLGEKERLCAVSLAKRFAWAACLADKLGGRPEDRRFPDTATVAAAVWLKEGETLDPETVWRQRKQWNGQWLHWSSPNQEKEEGEAEVRDDVWKTIRKKKDSQGPPPAYYAILMLDGDKMGEKLRHANQKRYGEISQALTRFAVEDVPSIVREHDGEPVYAAGDDVLAMLPTTRVIDCAEELKKAYASRLSPAVGQAGVDGTKATVSAGIAVVHHKEDLRFALEQARKAERAAKDAGRNRLAMFIARRSGEHSCVTFPWDLCGDVHALIGNFINGLSDRWAYRLRAEVETLAGLPDEAFKKEALRLVRRTEKWKDFKLEKWAMGILEKLRKLESERKPERDRTWREDFVMISQAASFLARGRDQ